MKLKEKIYLFVFFVCLFIFFIHPLSSDGDFYHHINIGKYVVEHKKLPHFDEFTFTSNGKEFIGYAWASGVIFYLIYSSFGNVGISLLLTSIAALTFILIYLWLKRYKISNGISLLTIAFAATIISTRWPDRPEVFTYPLLISLFLIDHLKQKYPRIVIIFPVIILLWVNLYGASVLLGLGILLLLGVKSLFLKESNKILFYLSIFISFPISLINGYAFKSIFFFSLLPKMNKLLGDWSGIFEIMSTSSLDYLLQFQYKLLLYLIYFIVYLLLVLTSWQNLKENKFIFFLSLSIFLPFLAFRFLPHAVVLSLPLFTVLIQQKLIKSSIWKLFFVAIVIFTFFISIWLVPPGLGEDTDSFPPQLIHFLKKNNLSKRVFNTQRSGAFLTYHLYPKILVFTDTRDELFLQGSPLDDAYATIARRRNILPLLKKYKTDIVIGDLNDGISYRSLFYSNEWSPVYLTDRYIVASKNNITIQKKLKIFDAIDPFSNTASKPGMENKAIEQYEYLIKDQPASYYFRFFLSSALIGESKFDQSTKILKNLKSDTGPNKILVEIDRNINLSQVYLAQGNCNSAKKYLDQAQDYSKNKLIFSPFKIIPSTTLKGYVSYYIYCHKDKARARLLLDQYIKEFVPGLLEKERIKKEFEQLLK